MVVVYTNHAVHTQFEKASWAPTWPERKEKDECEPVPKRPRYDSDGHPLTPKSTKRRRSLSPPLTQGLRLSWGHLQWQWSSQLNMAQVASWDELSIAD